MDAQAFEHHLLSPSGRGFAPAGGYTAEIGGGACCDTVRVSLAVDGGYVTGAGFDARGCGAATAAGSAAVTLVRGRALLDAARIGAGEIAAELGGLSPGKRHAADVAAEALARALGMAACARAALPRADGRTLVAMSGGVDSAVAAVLCASKGEAVGVTLELWGDAENDAERSCCSATAVAQARALAHSLGLPHLTVDLRTEFREGVVEPFIAGYAAGQTPNPCVMCNGHVRLDAMIALADRLGCATLATGHYARVEDGLLRAAADPAKDQTYMLAALAPESLRRLRFPLGELTKPEVRKLAARMGLQVASKPDSQDLCFLAGTSRARFLERHGGLSGRRGDVVDRAGNVLAAHQGHARFTVGQRRGTGVAGTGDAQYVLEKDASRNRVVVGPLEALLVDRVRLRGTRLHRDAARVDRVKLRYRQLPLPARVVTAAGGGVIVELDEPVAGAAPGQLACLMDGELVIGWGTIAAR